MKNILKIIFCIFNIAFFILLFQTKTSAMILKSSSSLDDGNEGKKVIYLTFDDGPSILTEKVLEALKENDVKATFFIIGNQIDGFEDILIRIHNEGHSIGLHTYTHNFKRIYSSRKAFIKEMMDCRNEINKVVGISPSIIRFPGGNMKHLNDSY